ncbi:MAG: stage V sporulation protein AB [Lachnospiraceae bacterium]|nr:stage V sporulation protein AB [Lachnospiraceae bacterium]MDE7331000.1 stage V sporulation protein AB [Lachnospiraceae bacterium]
MFLKQLFLGVCGLSFGLLASAGVFTVLVSVGLIPRFAGKMHVAKKVFALEEAVVFGTLAGGFLSVFGRYGEIGSFVLSRQIFGPETVGIWKWAGNIFLCAGGFFAGMFVGCLALAIAEMLNSIPIFSRRIGFRHGLGVAIAAAALGKLTGSLLYFARGIYMSGM